MDTNDGKETVNAEITITAKSVEPGLLVSLKTSGDFSSARIDQRFYSIDRVPPSDITPGDFWSPILVDIGRFLAGE